MKKANMTAKEIQTRLLQGEGTEHDLNTFVSQEHVVRLPYYNENQGGTSTIAVYTSSGVALFPFSDIGKKGAELMPKYMHMMSVEQIQRVEEYIEYLNTIKKTITKYGIKKEATRCVYTKKQLTVTTDWKLRQVLHPEDDFVTVHFPEYGFHGYYFLFLKDGNYIQPIDSVDRLEGWEQFQLKHMKKWEMETVEKSLAYVDKQIDMCELMIKTQRIRLLMEEQT